jgi:hypothetical protein
MEEGKRMLAWAIRHDSHGIHYDTLCFIPEGEVPETDFEWRRLPWLDEPGPEPSRILTADHMEKVNETHVPAIING